MVISMGSPAHRGPTFSAVGSRPLGVIVRPIDGGVYTGHELWEYQIHRLHVFTIGDGMPTTVRLKEGLETRIKRLAEETGRSQSFYINQMIEREIDRIEREYSILRDVEAYRAGRLATITLSELNAELGVIDPVDTNVLDEIE